MRDMSAPPPPDSPTKLLRSDGLEARHRLLDAALTLFAEKGFAKTSTREIAQAAQANSASISYYFGDKEGLYRAVFEDPRNNPQIDTQQMLQANADANGIRSAIGFMLHGFVEPLKAGDQARQCMKLHFREMLEPTGLWQAEIDNNIKPAHAALTQALARHLGVAEADDDIHRLAFQIAGLGIMLHVGLDVLQAIRPALLATSAALDTYHARLVDSSMALVDAEAVRRAQLKKPKNQARPKGTTAP
jgi:AcrR family transcriptional regulator